jgi:hypothetical protein
MLQSAFLDAHRHAAHKSLMHKLLLRRFTQPDPAFYAVLRDRFEATSRASIARTAPSFCRPTGTSYTKGYGELAKRYLFVPVFSPVHPVGQTVI